MTYEKIINRRDGSKLKISVMLIFGYYSGDPDFIYRHMVQYCPPGKRKYQETVLSTATDKELYQAKLEFWEKLKPIPHE